MKVLCGYVLNSFKWIQRNVVTGADGKSLMSFIRNCQTVFLKWLYHCAFQPAVNESSCFSTSLSAVGGVSISDLAILTLMLWYLVLISIFLMLYGIKHHIVFWIIFFFLFFSHFNFVLGYSQLTKLWLFQVNSKGIQPYVYMYPFSPKPSSHPGGRILFL